MKANHNSKTELVPENPRSGAVFALCRILGSARAAVFLVVLFLVACALGTFLPQGAAAGSAFAGLPNSEAWIKAAAVVGFTHVYSSWWFIALLFVFIGGLAACSGAKALAVRRATGAEARRAFASALTHGSLLLIIAAGLVRALFSETGTINLREGESAAHFTHASQTRPLPFAIRLEKFETVTESTPRQLASAGPLLGSMTTGLKSSVTITDGNVARLAEIAINQPLTLAGYRIYQVTDTAKLVGGRTVLQVVRDPSTPLAYAGFGLLLLSLVVTLYINPWLNTRRVIA